MELRFISKEEEKEVTRRGRLDKYPWKEAIAALSARPNQWAELPFTIAFPSSVEVVKRRYTNISFICRDGNMKRVTDPAKKNWRVFMKLEEKPMADNTFLSIRYEEHTDRYYTDLYVNNVAKNHKYLTSHEAEALSAYLHCLHDGKKEIVDISVAEIVEQIEDGDILLDEESNLYQMLEEART